jgi:thiol-disulfide isomerase/thioredoxin
MLNKHVYLQLGLLLLSGIARAQERTFTLTGTIRGKADAYMYLTYLGGGLTERPVRDSCLIRKGAFSFKGTLSGPAEVVISLDRVISSASEKTVWLFFVPGNMELSLDYENFIEGAVLKGSSVQEEAEVLAKPKALLLKQHKVISEACRKAYGLYREAVKAKKDEATLECLKAAADAVEEAKAPLNKELNKIDLAFMDQYPASYVTAARLRTLVKYIPFQDGQQRYNKLPHEIKQSSLGKNIKEELDKTGRGATGVQAYPFAVTELRGGALKLSGYKGKYVLLDFWASWCVPCRKGNPHLLSLYEKYKDKGLEIIGIASDDRDPAAWKKAVEKDGIGVWKHVLNGTTTNADTSISVHYGIITLPTKILVDPKGTIIGRYGADAENDAALDKKLAELTGK